MKLPYLLSVLLLTLFFVPAGLSAQNADDLQKQRQELKEKFKERYPTLALLKKQGKVGEKWNGEADAVEPKYLNEKVDPTDDKSPTVEAFLREENSDRRKLYGILAKQVKSTPEKVALRDGERRFSRAEKHEYLLPKDGRWITKADLDEQNRKRRQQG